MVWTTLNSIASGIYRRVVPLYWVDHRERVYIAGSAVPFEDDGSHCLLTAAHVCLDDVLRPQPLFTNGYDRPWALTEIRGVWKHEPQATPDVDVGVVTLTPDCAEDLARYYQFSTTLDLSALLPKSESTCYMLGGYAASRNRARSPGRLPSLATFFVMTDIRPLDDLRIANKSADCHFALSVPANHRRIGGGQFHLPDLHGMSGGGIWRFEVDNANRLVTTPHLVGIGIEYHKDKRAIVGTHIQAAMPLVRDLFDRSRTDSSAV